jgi:hypothetical protein
LEARTIFGEAVADRRKAVAACRLLRRLLAGLAAFVKGGAEERSAEANPPAPHVALDRARLVVDDFAKVAKSSHVPQSGHCS